MPLRLPAAASVTEVRRAAVARRTSPYPCGRLVGYFWPALSFFGFFAAADPLPVAPSPEALPCLAAASASICLIRLFGRISVQFCSMKSRHSWRPSSPKMTSQPSGTSAKTGQSECCPSSLIRTRYLASGSSKGFVATAYSLSFVYRQLYAIIISNILPAAGDPAITWPACSTAARHRLNAGTAGHRICVTDQLVKRRKTHWSRVATGGIPPGILGDGQDPPASSRSMPVAVCRPRMSRTAVISASCLRATLTTMPWESNSGEVSRYSKSRHPAW